MRIKQTTFYAIRILYRLHREKTNLVTSKYIAKKEEISQGVILKILRVLSHAGIVKVHQGRGQISRGFALAKSIDDITMADIMGAMEGMDVGVNLEEASNEQEASLHQVCEQINERLEQLFSTYSLRQLLESEKEP